MLQLQTVFIISHCYFFVFLVDNKYIEKDIDVIVGWCGGCEYLHKDDIYMKNINNEYIHPIFYGFSFANAFEFH